MAYADRYTEKHPGEDATVSTVQPWLDGCADCMNETWYAYDSTVQPRLDDRVVRQAARSSAEEWVLSLISNRRKSYISLYTLYTIAQNTCIYKWYSDV